MNHTKLVLLLAFGALSAGGVALAGGFEDQCIAQTEEMHPEISDPAEGCACIAGQADDGMIEELMTASDAGDLADATKEAMRSCGYSI